MENEFGKRKWKTCNDEKKNHVAPHGEISTVSIRRASLQARTHVCTRVNTHVSTRLQTPRAFLMGRASGHLRSLGSLFLSSPSCFRFPGMSVPSLFAFQVRKGKVSGECALHLRQGSVVSGCARGGAGGRPTGSWAMNLALCVLCKQRNGIRRRALCIRLHFYKRPWFPFMGPRAGASENAACFPRSLDSFWGAG